MFRSVLLIAVSLCLLRAAPAASPDPVYAPLWLYNGSWQVSPKNLQPGAKPDTLLNQCALVGRYFTCQQTVNGMPEELLIFVPAKTPGHYYTQSVMPEGRAGGRGDLAIDGDHWTYSSTWDQGGHTTYYRTINIFTGKNQIHFEQQESPNNKDWKVTNSGDEKRVASAPMTVVR